MGFQPSASSNLARFVSALKPFGAESAGRKTMFHVVGEKRIPSKVGNDRAVIRGLKSTANFY